MKHIIILGSSYLTGKRIALDYCDNDLHELEKIITELNKLNKTSKKQFSIATHTIDAKSEKWSDVVKTDSFFDKVELVNNKFEFIRLLSDDKEISSLDIANYILTQYECTHTRLEKLTYFCYADYLCKYNKKLFNDTIYAFKYGPVVKSIYDKYKRSNYELYSNSETIMNEKDMKINKQYEMPVRSRIIASNDGIEKINSIDETLKKYKNYDTQGLIELTHKEGTPWTINDKGKKSYKEISDDDILKYHIHETNNSK